MKVRPIIAAMSAYKPPLEARNQPDYLLLDFNESTVPPSAEVLAAIKGFLDSGRVQVYPSYAGLLERLSAYTGRAPEEILLTNGSDQAIEVIARALLEPGDEMVTAVPTFPMIPHVPETIGARVVRVPYGEELAYPLEAVMGAVTPRTRMIAVTSPNNPTGTSIAPAQLRTLLKTFPQVGVMVDEAYHEFSGVTCATWIDEFDNLAITRTFSKAFAMAGLRLGYALSNAAFIGELHKVRGPYDVNILAVKGAEAVLDHQAGWRAYVDEVMQRAKPRVERFFQERGVRFHPSDANFMLVEPASVAAAVDFLKARGILVRLMRPPIEHLFRVSIGREADMARFMTAYGEFLDQGAAARQAGDAR